MHEKGLRFDKGLGAGAGQCAVGISILVSSDVPEGKGVSSSAAVEVGNMNTHAMAHPTRIRKLTSIIYTHVIMIPICIWTSGGHHVSNRGCYWYHHQLPS
jgi:galactokinase